MDPTAQMRSQVLSIPPMLALDGSLIAQEHGAHGGKLGMVQFANLQ